MIKIFDGLTIYDLTDRDVTVTDVTVENIERDSFDICVSGWYEGNWNTHELHINVAESINIALRYITNVGFSDAGAILMAKQIATATNKVVNLLFAGEIEHSIAP